MRRVVVTGATGFVGQAVLKALEGRQVSAVPVSRSGAQSEGLLSHASVEEMRFALQGVTAVIHLAASVHDMRGVTPEAEFMRVNRDYTLRLAEAAADAGVRRFVFASSIKVNGDNTSDGEAFSEQSRVAPKGAYAASKWEAEQGLLALSDRRSLEVRVVRPPLVYGAGIKGNMQSIYRWIRRGVFFPFGDIRRNRRSLVYVDNLADVLLRLALGEGSAERHRTYLVSDGTDTSTAQLFESVSRSLGMAPRLFHVPEGVLRATLALLKKESIAQRLLDSLRVDSTGVRRELGWEPPVSFDEGIARTGAWFRSAG